MPAGKNCLSQLTCTSYLVRFTNLQLLNLLGNPLCQDPDYKSYVLSHLKHLRYLDYRCVPGTAACSKVQRLLLPHFEAVMF